VRIIPLGQDSIGTAERQLADRVTDRREDAVQYGDELGALGATAAYALKREDRLVGLMLVTAEPRTLTSEKHAVLGVLSGQVAAAIEGCRLVEEKVRLERELASRERLALLGQMAATVAHEVKNPLSSIKSIAQVMREDEGLESYDGDLKLIISEIDRLNRTVSQLLSFSRPARANGGDNAGPTSFGEIVASTIALLSADAAERNVTVSVEKCPPDVTLSESDAGPVRDILSNLLINAIQATQPGGMVVILAEVQVSPASGSSAAHPLEDAYGRSVLVLSVSDNGPGIPEETQIRVFDPFYTTKPRGTGLGLAIVRRRVAELGAAIQLISPAAAGRGTCFRMILPLREPSPNSAAGTQFAGV
jgi:signal transduction histidine kinase